MIEIRKTEDSSTLSKLKEAWYDSLLAPQDGMWEMFINTSTPYEISSNGKPIGYACINAEGILLQFFIELGWMQESKSVFKKLLDQTQIKTAMVGTNNPVFLSSALPFQKSVEVDTLLFTEVVDAQKTDQEGIFRSCEESDQASVVDFYHRSIGAPKEWLEGYLGGHIQKEEIFIFEKENEILGSCEVRKSDSQLQYADVGMVVSPDHRKKGIGTFLLSKTIEIAKGWNRKAICSCEATNTGSFKAIQNSGFRSIHQLLRLSF